MVSVNETFEHSDQDSVNRHVAKGMWGQLPGQIKKEKEKSILTKLPGMGRQALNESDFAANYDQYKAMFHQVLAVGLNGLVICVSNMDFFKQIFGRLADFDMTYF